MKIWVLHCVRTDNEEGRVDFKPQLFFDRKDAADAEDIIRMVKARSQFSLSELEVKGVEPSAQ